MKKRSALILAALLCFSLLAGCDMGGVGGENTRKITDGALREVYVPEEVLCIAHRAGVVDEDPGVWREECRDRRPERAVGTRGFGEARIVRGEQLAQVHPVGDRRVGHHESPSRAARTIDSDHQSSFVESTSCCTRSSAAAWSS